MGLLGFFQGHQDLVESFHLSLNFSTLKFVVKMGLTKEHTGQWHLKSVTPNLNLFTPVKCWKPPPGVARLLINDTGI